ncbi:MAG: circularly permuted type 2 ATP-grasp protein [Maioricimonas sp. JB045]
MNGPMATSEVTDTSLFAEYSPAPGHYDEMFRAPGAIRPHWIQLAQQFDIAGHDQIAARWEQAQRQIRDNGITYNAHGDVPGDSRPWELDAVPLVLPAEEWREITEALAQRAAVMDHILRDLFGPQKLIRDGFLPPELLFAHPGYHPAYHGLPAPGGRHLHLYAADIARSPDGQWWVTGDRTRAPFGLGYALENRNVTSRMIAPAFRSCRVSRLAPFFITLRETLQRLAPHSGDNPRIALLTKGPASTSYFEDAYLARYLGYTLAEGGDLAVRENRLTLKTLGGLLPVEVLFRRLDDDDCDPVELRADSNLGVAGLVEVARNGQTTIANALGSRLVESPAFVGFLQLICEHLFGEELRIPSIATWWCGQPKALEYVIEHLDELVIRPAFRMGDVPLIYPGRLSRTARQELLAAIKARPSEYVAQERVSRSTAPAWSSGQFQPWHIAVRSFLVASGQGYQAMPGGLVRVSQNTEVLDRSMTAGERSQDLWVLADGPIDDVSLLAPPGQPIPLRRSGAELPSRVADNLYWLGRYIERSEGSARLLRSVLLRITSETGSENMSELPVLLRALADQGQIEPDFVINGLHEQLPRIEDSLPEAVFNTQEPRTLRSTINQVRRLGSIVRDRLSADAWRIILQIDQQARRPPRWQGGVDPADVLSVVNHVIVQLSAFSGLASESMTRTQSWRFLDIGRRIERAVQTTALLNATLVDVGDDELPLLEAVLEVADSMMTYRSRYLASLQVAPALDLLITDEANPRSISYQAAVLADHVDHLPRDAAQAIRGPEERIALSMLNTLRLSDPNELAHVGTDGRRRHLERLLQRITENMPKLSDAISNRFLIHAGVPRQFAQTSPEITSPRT